MTQFIILIASMMSIVAISIDAMIPALGVMGADLGAAYANQTQFILSAVFIGMMVGQLICGPLSDALGRKKILYGGLAFYAVGSAVCFFAQSMEAVIIGRVIQGLGISGPYVTAIAVVRDKFAGRDMARVMSLVMMIFILVPAIAPSIGQGILFFAPWQGIFAFYIVYAAIVGAGVFFMLEETLRPEDRIKFSVKEIAKGFRTVFTTRVTMCYTIAPGLMFGSLIGYLNSSQQIFQGLFGVGTSFALYFGGLALTIGVASMVNSRIVGRVGMHAVCHRATYCLIAASSAFLILNALTDVTLWMFVAYAATMFFCFGLMFGNLNSIAMEPMGHIAGIASAVIGSTSSLISLVVGAVIGQLYDGTLTPLATGFLVMNILSLGLMKVAQGK